MNETQALRQEIAELRQKIGELTEQLDAVRRFSRGIQGTLIQVLPELLREQPNLRRAQELLTSSHNRHSELLAYPERAEPESHHGAAEAADDYLSSSWIYQNCALLGVWPDVDPQQFREQLLAFQSSLRSESARQSE